MGCELTQTVLHGYMDGELDAARAADFERHLISCADCVAVLEANESVRSSIQRAGLYERAPRALRQKVQAQLAGNTQASVMPIRKPAQWALARLSGHRSRGAVPGLAPAVATAWQPGNGVGCGYCGCAPSLAAAGTS